MSLTSFNGSVDVTVPPTTKANLKLRSDRGDVYTDFDVQPVAAPKGTPPDRPNRARERDEREKDREKDGDDDRARPAYRLDVDRSIYGTINGGGSELELRTFNGNIYLRRAK